MNVDQVNNRQTDDRILELVRKLRNDLIKDFLDRHHLVRYTFQADSVDDSVGVHDHNLAALRARELRRARRAWRGRLLDYVRPHRLIPVDQSFYQCHQPTYVLRDHALGLVTLGVTTLGASKASTQRRIAAYDNRSQE